MVKDCPFTHFFWHDVLAGATTIVMRDSVVKTWRGTGGAISPNVGYMAKCLPLEGGIPNHELH